MNGFLNEVNERICWGCGEKLKFIYIKMKMRNYILWTESSLCNF